jgi:NAD(P)H dehydrogenase (quinone)
LQGIPEQEANGRTQCFSCLLFGTGVTEALATAIAVGASSRGADVRLRCAREVVASEIMAKAPGWMEAAEAMNKRHPAPVTEDAEWADALVLGTPTRFGSISSELKAYIDSLGDRG